MRRHFFYASRQAQPARERERESDIIRLSGILETYEFIKARARMQHMCAAAGRAAAAALVSLFLAA